LYSEEFDSISFEDNADTLRLRDFWKNLMKDSPEFAGNRSFESVFKLAKALARLTLKTTVDSETVDEIIGYISRVFAKHGRQITQPVDYLTMTFLEVCNIIKILPAMNLLMGSFLAYLKETERQKMKQLQYNVTKNGNVTSATATTIAWIEKLLQVPLPDRRKYCMWKILAPYLINQSFAIMANWLQECNKLHRLDFNANLKIKDNLNSALKTGYFPTGLYKLNSADPQFCNFLQEYGVI
jgi:hypothetical protein